jgi:hypothetical protein
MSVHGKKNLSNLKAIIFDYGDVLASELGRIDGKSQAQSGWREQGSASDAEQRGCCAGHGCA